MKTISIIAFALLTIVATQADAAYKCQGADGKVEYSDRPCETNKNTLDKPKANTGVITRAIANPMEQLDKIFVDYYARLCEREKLADEIAEASRKGDIAKQPAQWRAKQDRQIELNDVQVDFQLRASKITREAGNDSKEMAAMRKFQLGLKKCDPTKPYVPQTAPSAEVKAEPKTTVKPNAATPSK